MTATAARAALDAAVVAQLEREVFVSRACLRAYGPCDGPPDRPDWWGWMTPHMQDVAAAAEDAGLWRVPRGSA